MITLQYDYCNTNLGWKLMLGLRKHHHMLYLKHVIKAWFVIAAEDKARLFLPVILIFSLLFQGVVRDCCTNYATNYVLSLSHYEH